MMALGEQGWFGGRVKMPGPSGPGYSAALPPSSSTTQSKSYHFGASPIYITGTKGLPFGSVYFSYQLRRTLTTPQHTAVPKWCLKLVLYSGEHSNL